MNHTDPYDYEKPLMIVVMVSPAFLGAMEADAQGPASW